MKKRQGARKREWMRIGAGLRCLSQVPTDRAQAPDRNPELASTATGLRATTSSGIYKATAIASSSCAYNVHVMKGQQALLLQRRLQGDSSKELQSL